MIYNCANWAGLPWTEVRPGVRRKAFTGEGHERAAAPP